MGYVMPSRCKSPPMGGFSLIELLVVMAVAAILLAIALPSFSDVMVRNRIASSANEFIAAVTYARSEAIRRGGTAGICASSNRTSCTGAWSDGWLVWADANRNGTLDAAEVLRVGAASGDDDFTAADVGTEVRFTRRGVVDATYLNATTPDAEFTLKPDSCRAGKPHVRTLTLTLTGQVRLVEGNCT